MTSGGLGEGRLHDPALREGREQELHREEWELIRTHIARLRASVMAVVFGLVGGAGLFVATVWLLVRGGNPVGPHLALLSNYFPGYTVTWVGSLVGFAYGTAVGALAGGALAWLYNWIANRRNGR